MTYYIVIFCKYSQFSEYEDYLKCQVLNESSPITTIY